MPDDTPGPLDPMLPPLTVLDLFSGIGGFALGLESTGGFETIAFCEIDPWCRKVLAKHWPGAPQHADVRSLTTDVLAGLGRVDCVCGGFPCQDISIAGRGEGIGTAADPTARSGLVWELLRVIRSVRPLLVLLENVPALRNRGFDAVADGLEQAGYSCRPFVVGAWAVGAPHRRNRVWIVGRRRVADSQRDEPQRVGVGGGLDGAAGGTQGEVRQRQRVRNAAVDSGEDGLENTQCHARGREVVGGEVVGAAAYGPAGGVGRSGCGDGSDGLALPAGGGCGPWDGHGGEPGEPGCGRTGLGGSGAESGSEHPCAFCGYVFDRDLLGKYDCPNCEGEGLADADGPGFGEHERPVASETQHPAVELPCCWPARPGQPQADWEPSRTLGAVPDGLPGRLVRSANRNALRAAGNSVVPQVVAAVGRAMLAAFSEFP